MERTYCANDVGASAVGCGVDYACAVAGAGCNDA